jgi:serine phosphatase RsbU (regulator of sigma subunit)
MNLQMEEFGKEKLKSLVQRNEGVSALVLIERILASVSAHVNDASQSDDMTIVLINRLDQRGTGS